MKKWRVFLGQEWKKMLASRREKKAAHTKKRNKLDFFFLASAAAASAADCRSIMQFYCAHFLLLAQQQTLLLLLTSARLSGRQLPLPSAKKRKQRIFCTNTHTLRDSMNLPARDNWFCRYVYATFFSLLCTHTESKGKKCCWCLLVGVCVKKENKIRGEKN